MNRQIAISALSIVMALGLTVGGTLAVFSDEAESTGNTFSTGNADLQIAPDNNDQLGGTPGAFDESIVGPDTSNMFPGDERVHYFWLRNNSSSDIDLNLFADIDRPNPFTNVLGDAILISWACDINDNNVFDPEEISAQHSVNTWINGGNADLGVLASNTNVECGLTSSISESADNTIAGESINFDVVYDGEQVIGP